jgi:transposase
VSRRQKEPLRPFTEQERALLEQLSRSRSEPIGHVMRARALLALEGGKSYTEAAHQVGYALGDSVAQLVARFHQEGVDALAPRHAGGPPIVYTAAEREQILSEARRTPDREQDATATWSLTTLQKSLRNKGLPKVSTYTIWCVLHEAGISFQKNRSWEPTGTALRKRKSGVVAVTDPDTEAKKT